MGAGKGDREGGAVQVEGKPGVLDAKRRNDWRKAREPGKGLCTWQPDGAVMGREGLKPHMAASVEKAR